MHGVVDMAKDCIDMSHRRIEPLAIFVNEVFRVVADLEVRRVAALDVLENAADGDVRFRAGSVCFDHDLADASVALQSIGCRGCDLQPLRVVECTKRRHTEGSLLFAQRSNGDSGVGGSIEAEVDEPSLARDREMEQIANPSPGTWQ